MERQSHTHTHTSCSFLLLDFECTNRVLISWLMSDWPSRQPGSKTCLIAVCAVCACAALLWLAWVGKSLVTVIHPGIAVICRCAQSAVCLWFSDEHKNLEMTLRSFKSIIGRFSRFPFDAIVNILSEKSPRLGRGKVPVLTAMSLTISLIQSYSLSSSAQSTFHCKLNKTRLAVHRVKLWHL